MEVVATDEFVTWLESLSAGHRGSVEDAINVLSGAGTSLGHPRASAIKGTRFAIRELRVQSKGRPLRIFYAFDPRRDAVLILGGDKGGDARFYERTLPRVEAIWRQYLTEQAAGLHDDKEE